MKIREISVDEILTYLHCPMKYRFKYVEKLEEKEEISAAFKKAVHQSIYYFYFNLLSGKMPTLQNMKNKWASLWKEKQNQAEDTVSFLLQERKSLLGKKGGKTESRYSVQGMELLYNFYRSYQDNPGVPIAINHPYRVPINNMVITGNFELIREIVDNETRTRFIDIVDFKTTSETQIDTFLIKHDLYASVASYAFRNLFHAKEDRYIYSFLRSGREFAVRKQEEDFNRMKAIIIGVTDGMKNKYYYPRQGIQCKTCPFRTMCDRVKF